MGKNYFFGLKDESESDCNVIKKYLLVLGKIKFKNLFSTFGSKMKKYLVLCSNRLIFLSIHIQRAVNDLKKLIKLFLNNCHYNTYNSSNLFLTYFY